MAADRLLHQHRSARHRVIWCEGCNNDQVNRVGRDTGNGECAGSGNRPHRCGGLASSGNMSFANAGARADPLVARLHDLLKIGVGEDCLRHLVPPSDDVRRAIRERR